MNIEKLLPCPFCGEEMVRNPNGLLTQHNNFSSCKCILLTFFPNVDYPGVVEKWNTRTESQEIKNIKEAFAKFVYDQWSNERGYTPWVKGGNSFKQDEARALAMKFIREYKDE